MDFPFEEEINAEVSSNSNDASRQKLSYSDIAEKLIRDKLWLTALELHAELNEAGKEVPRLRDFFSNPGNFENQSKTDFQPSISRSSSQATLDSLDFTRYSEDGERGNDERIAVLEFELRKAKDTISALRATLTVATGEGTSSAKFVKGEPVKPHESRALNFLINEYLLKQGYKLTTITFADENEGQDFEDWDDVGLNMPKPSELLHLYRVGIRQAEGPVNSVSTQTDPIIEIKIEEPTPVLEDTVIIPEEHEEDIRLDIAEIREDKKEEKDKEVSEASGSFEEIEAAGVCEEAVISVGSSQDGSCNNSSVSRTISTVSSEVWSELPHLPQLEGYECFSYEELVSALSLHLPSLLPHLPVNNKEWLQRMVPLLVCLISLQQDATLREGLIHSLLEIKRRPSQEDRNIILSGMMRVCETLNEAAIEKHLLPHCWELMSHKYPEKRALVAQACPHVSLYISRELRESLIISILKQLLEDKEEIVRAEAVGSLAHIAATMSRNYHQVEDLTLKAVIDKSDAVVKVSLRQLCPVTARWAYNRGRLTQFLSSILAKISGYIKEEKSTTERDRSIVMCLRALTSCLPYLVTEIPCPDVMSPLLQWVKDNLVPDILNLIENVDSKREDVVVGFVKFFVSIHDILGTNFCLNQVKGLVYSRLENLESNLVKHNTSLSLSIIPVYALGVLAPLQLEEEIENTIGKLLVSVGLCGAPPVALCLVARRCAQDISLIESLLSALWQGVVHPQASVKETTSKLLAEVVPHVMEQIVSTRLLPPLVTLASDTDLSVRVSTLIVHTLIIECCSSREIVEKCYLETERIVCDGSVNGTTPIKLAIISSIGRMAPRVEATFREQVILRELDILSRKCTNESEEIIGALVEAFSNTVYCQISKHTIVNTLIPSLRHVEAACIVRLPTHSETVSNMIRELEARLPAPTPQSIPRSGSSLSLNPGNVEDMKQKVTRIFTSPISKQTNLQNIFWKKN